MGLALPFIKQDKKNCNVITSWYRPPEVAIKYEYYDYKADIWSLGCIFFEIISRTVFCQVIKDDSQEILRTILENLPQTPTSDDYRKVTMQNLSNKIFSPCNLRKLTHRSLTMRFSLVKNALERVSICYSELCDFIESTLQLNWEKRPSTYQLLQFPLFRNFSGKNINCPNICWQQHVMFRPCSERNYFVDICKKFFNSVTYGYVNWRMIFQAFSLLDRYFLLVPDISHNYVETEIRFYICLYISYKYFSDCQPSAFEDFYNFKDLDYVKQFEGYLIYQILKLNIYQPTLYEIFDDFEYALTEKDNTYLLYLYLSDNRLHGLSYTDIANYYLKNQLESLLSRHPLQPVNGQ
jgi:hypothetical protein